MPNGKRFTNEADSYHDFIAALLDSTPPGETPQAWLIADSRALRRYGLGHARPFPFTPEAWRRTGYLQTGETPEALAKACAINPQQLTETIARFNDFVDRGEDKDFQRGASAYNRAQGDASRSPHPTLGKLSHAPFMRYAFCPARWAPSAD